MKAQFIISFMIFLGVSIAAKAQDSGLLQLHPFDIEKYKGEYQEDHLFDSPNILTDTLAMNTKDQYPMRILEVPQKEMAQMPNMQIRDDVNYTLRIKKYNSYKIPESQIMKYHLLPNRDGDNSPLNDKRK